MESTRISQPFSAPLSHLDTKTPPILQYESHHEIPPYKRDTFDPFSLSFSAPSIAQPQRIAVQHCRPLCPKPATEIIFLLYLVTLFLKYSIKLLSHPTCLKLRRPKRLQLQSPLLQADRNVRAMILYGSERDAL